MWKFFYSYSVNHLNNQTDYSCRVIFWHRQHRWIEKGGGDHLNHVVCTFLLAMLIHLITWRKPLLSENSGRSGIIAGTIIRWDKMGNCPTVWSTSTLPFQMITQCNYWRKQAHPQSVPIHTFLSSYQRQLLFFVVGRIALLWFISSMCDPRH